MLRESGHQRRQQPYNALPAWYPGYVQKGREARCHPPAQKYYVVVGVAVELDQAQSGALKMNAVIALGNAIGAVRGTFRCLVVAAIIEANLAFRGFEERAKGTLVAFPGTVEVHYNFLRTGPVEFQR